jgi:hypothetical protein
MGYFAYPPPNVGAKLKSPIQHPISKKFAFFLPVAYNRN